MQQHIVLFKLTLRPLYFTDDTAQATFHEG